MKRYFLSIFQHFTGRITVGRVDHDELVLLTDVEHRMVKSLRGDNSIVTMAGKSP